VKGAKCLGGVNSVLPPNCWDAPDRVDGLQPCDHCEGAWLPVICYMTFNCLFNVVHSSLFIITLTKYLIEAMFVILME
jgi:hypothetical protein